MSNESNEKQEPQIFRVVISPRQRMEILNLSEHDGKWLQGKEAVSRFMRFRTAFGLNLIRTAARQRVLPDGRVLVQVNAQKVAENTPAEFTLTYENVAFLIDFLAEAVPFTTNQVDVLYPLFETLRALRAGEVVEQEKARAFDPATDGPEWIVSA